MGKRTYTDEMIASQPLLHSVTTQTAFDKKEVALAIGMKMIADGCIKVETYYDIEIMKHTYIWVARPFSKERMLP